MGLHTIEVDDDALARLNAHRSEGKTATDLIRRYVPAPPSAPEYPLRTVAGLRALMERRRADPLGDDAVAAVEQVIAERGAPANKRDNLADDAGPR